MTEPYYSESGVTIYCADCREILPQFLDPVDHVITDPPYARDVYMRTTRLALAQSGVKGINGTSGLVAMRAGAIGAVDELIEPVGSLLARMTARWIIVYSDVESIHLWRAALEAAGARYVRTGAWIKSNPMPQMTGDRPAVGFEPCTIAHGANGSKMQWNGGGRPAAWRYPSDQERPPVHPCPKPLRLLVKQIEQFTDPGEIVLDPFMGSGTTLVAAKALGRRAIGIEVEEKYCRSAVERLRQGVLFPARDNRNA